MTAIFHRQVRVTQRGVENSGRAPPVERECPRPPQRLPKGSWRPGRFQPSRFAVVQLTEKTKPVTDLDYPWADAYTFSVGLTRALTAAYRLAALVLPVHILASITGAHP